MSRQENPCRFLGYIPPISLSFVSNSSTPDLPHGLPRSCPSSVTDCVLVVPNTRGTGTVFQEPVVDPQPLILSGCGCFSPLTVLDLSPVSGTRRPLILYFVVLVTHPLPSPSQDTLLGCVVFSPLQTPNLRRSWGVRRSVLVRGLHPFFLSSTVDSDNHPRGGVSTSK